MPPYDYVPTLPTRGGGVTYTPPALGNVPGSFQDATIQNDGIGGGFSNWWERNGEGVEGAVGLLPSVYCTIFPRKCAQAYPEYTPTARPDDNTKKSTFILYALLAVLLIVVVLAMVKKK